MSSLYKRQLNEWKSTIDVRGKVLDIGGAQDPLSGKTKSFDTEDYQILDLPVPHVETRKPDIKWDMNNLIGDEFPSHKSYYDMVFCLGVFDYIVNPDNGMQNLKYFMANDGVAWVEFPFFYCTHEPVNDEGCRYSEGCIRKLARRNNLEIEETVYKHAGNRHLVQFFIEDGQRMAKDVDHTITGFIVKFRKG